MAAELSSSWRGTLFYSPDTSLVLFRKCKELNSQDLMDAYMDQEVRKFLYNGGKGKLMPVAELVKARNKVSLMGL